MNFFRC